jgi:alpha-L-rhamnosidase
MTDWVARMITPGSELDAAPVFRRVVDLSRDVRRAVLHVTALGVVEASVNGSPVGDEVLAPGWTSYEWRLRVRSHDVTHLVGPRTEVRLLVGAGWHRGRLGFHGNRNLYGDEPGAFAQLEVEYADGRTEVVGTDASWEAGASGVLADDLYDGQTIDAGRLEPAVWGQVRELAFDTALLDGSAYPPVRRHESVRPVRVWVAASGETLLDFGQNLVGWLRFTVRGERGRTVTVRHAEVLDDGELCVRPLRTAQATDRLVLSGGTDTFEPTFTTHGFRYAGITGWPGELRADDVEAVVVHSEQQRIGRFACSDDRIDRLHENAVWTWRGNTVGVPTDCPQRDERFGWTGDLAVFAPSAAFLFDVGPFLRQWLVDLALEQQHADGRVPLCAPDCLKLEAPPEGLPPMDASAIWADASVWVPWALWTAYGDERVLRDQWPSMLAHVERTRDRLLSERGLWEGGFQFGDWLDPTAPPDQPGRSRADTGVVATAVFHRSVVLAARAASVLGLAREGAWLDALASDVRSAFLAHYVDESGRVHSDCPTAYALALELGLLDGDPRRQLAGDRLAELVRGEGHHIGTGFAGTAFVLDALVGAGHLDDAYALLVQTGCPSWLYPVTMGATTVWERWDSMLPDGSVNPGTMTSFNHYALASVADWLHRTVGGLAPIEPGYRRFRVAPRAGGGLTWATTSLETPHGRIEVAWTAEAGVLSTVDVTVPDGSEAEVDLGDGRTQVLGSGRHSVAYAGAPG